MPQPFSLTVNHSREFLLVVAVGRPLLSDLLAAVDYVAAVSAVHGDRCALLDLLSMDADLSGGEQASLEDRLARVLAHMKGIATVVRAHDSTFTPSFQDRDGLPPLRLFTSMKQATDWLSEIKAGGVTSSSAK